MVTGADDAAGEKDGGRKQSGLGRESGRIRSSRVKKKAITVVAKTSKKPSTHRCTTHQRQYSTIDKVRVLSPGQARAVEQADGRGGEHEEPEQVACARPDSSAPDEWRAPPGRARSASRRTTGSARRAPDRRIRIPDVPKETSWNRDSLLMTLSHSPVIEPATTTQQRAEKHVHTEALDTSARSR